MSTQDGRRILETARTSYPRSADLGLAYRESGLDRVRANRAVRNLIEAGLLELGRGTSAGLAWPELRLTEAGMAVASGIVSIENDARAAIAARETLMLRNLQIVRAGRRAQARASGHGAQASADPEFEPAR